jgi:inorganic pyrophosphatase
MKLPEPYAKHHYLNVIIETPYKSRNKFEYDKESGLFRLSKVIPAGLEFPCDMGFIPHTKGQDGDPLDALILMDEITYPGCLVACRVIGVMKATQVEKKKEVRNDRFFAVPAEMKEYDHLQDIKDLNSHKVKAIVNFFKNYNEQEGKEFRLLELAGPKDANDLIKKGVKK